MKKNKEQLQGRKKDKMTERCKNCGHAKCHHYRYVSLTTGEICYGHCYYPSRKARRLECNCFEFVKDTQKIKKLKEIKSK